MVQITHFDKKTSFCRKGKPYKFCVSVVVFKPISLVRGLKPVSIHSSIKAMGLNAGVIASSSTASITDKRVKLLGEKRFGLMAQFYFVTAFIVLITKYNN